MTLRLFCCSLVVFVLAGSVFGQGSGIPAPAMFKPLPPGSAELTAQQLLADRLDFVKEMYQPSAEQLGKITPLLDKLVPDQEKYGAKVRLTLRRLRLAVSVAATEPLNPEEETDRAGTMATLQDQIYALQAGAPLSFANVIRIVEPLLPKDEVNAAHARIKASLARRLKRDAAAIDIAKVDALLSPPVIPEEVPAMPPGPPPPSTPPVETKPAPPVEAKPPPPAEAKPQTPTPPVPPPAPTTQPAVVPPATTKPATPPLPPVVEAPKVVKPAPPEAEWTKQYEAAAAKYNLNDNQKKTAEQALKACMDRAAAYREKNKGDYEKAKAMSDPAQKEAAMKKLNEPLDKLYDELMQRVDSIATLEQRLRAEGKLAVPRAPTTAPASGPAAPKVEPAPPKPAAMPAQPLPKPTPVPPPPPPTTQPAHG